MAALLLGALSTWANATSVTADSMQTQGDTYVLKGNVEITTGSLSMKADEAVYNNKTGMINASGNILIKDGKMEAKATRAHINAETMAGSLFEADLLMGERGYRISSDEVLIKDRDNLKLKSATVTTCTGLPAAWCIKGSDFDVRVGDRLTARHARLKLRGLPIIYLPYIWVPIIEDRRTGFLVPSIGYRDTTGYYYRQPFFWAISSYTDATVMFEFHTDQAFGQKIEYRFLTGKDTGGRVMLRNLRDEVLERDYREARLLLTHRPHSVPLSGVSAGISAGLDLNFINRQDYFKRYQDDMSLSDTRYQDSRAEIWYDLKAHDRLYMNAMYKYDLKPGVNNDTVMQRAGELGYFAAPRNLGGGFTAYGKAEAANFTRDEDYTGKRMRLSAEVSHAMRVGYVNITQSLGYDHMGYSLTNSPVSPLMDGGMSTGYGSYNARALIWAGDYVGENLFMHTVEHSIDYSWQRRTGDTPDMFDLDELRPQHSSVIAYSITNRFRGPEGDMLKLRLRQPIDISGGSNKPDPFMADISANYREFSANASADYDHDTHGLGHMYTGLRYETEQYSLFAGHIYDRLESIETYRTRVRYRPSGKWSLAAGGSYDVKDEGGIEEKYASLSYKAQCWSVTTKYIDRPGEYGIEVSATLIGLGEVRTR